MEYVVVFLGGAAAATATLLIWYFAYISQLRKEKGRLKEWQHRLESQSSELNQQIRDLEGREGQLQQAVESLEGRKVRYSDLLGENSLLKQDLFNLSVELKKTERDQAAITQHQEEIDGRAKQIAEQHLKETVSWIGQKLSSRNFGTCKKQLVRAIERCREIGFDIPDAEEEGLVQDLKMNFEEAVRAEFAREEQARIKAQIREEERLKREADKLIQEAQREQAVIQAALEKALSEAEDEHSAEIELLRAKLREAEEKSERAISQAQMTRAGHVYVLSNIGAFGEGIYKIGMTRRLEPIERVRELSGASVPFPFDVHMMISCDDAPSLENALHREMHRRRMNKVNLRKEFFRTDLDSIKVVVEQHHGEVDYIAGPCALEYHESVNMTDEDYEFIEEIAQSLVDEEGDFNVEE